VLQAEDTKGSAKKKAKGAFKRGKWEDKILDANVPQSLTSERCFWI